MKRVCVFFADGTEECEALLVVDILRRAEVEVVTASIHATNQICSSHNVVIQTDTTADRVLNETFDAVVLPGGMPGTKHLAANEIVKQVCVTHANNNKLVAAICAAPSALAGFGLLDGVKATTHFAFTDQLAGAIVTNQPVVLDQNILTACGLGATLPFALQLAELLCSKEVADSIAAAIGFCR